ncbi:hypothetical protein ODJ79_40015 [Actinoplanes sp. KI2]|uniref:hypothetical protein n=1 Tax=Actinoplanes sp. KI2 TaxID=2983315 RepID=UPI0021D5FC09|nr:hypothetical protein [Actinoplanes sp. KI2]MCU7729940.1 hypothetical protein [Actinoplanes sp. KI2]
MRSTPARRELAFVLAVAAAGLAVVLAVVFAPWYPVAPPTSAGVTTVRDHIVHLVDDRPAGETTITR